MHENPLDDEGLDEATPLFKTRAATPPDAGAPVPRESSDALSAYLRQLHQRPLLTAAEEVALGTRIAQGDRDAHRLLVESNLRLVVSVARRNQYKARHLSLLDLINEGNMGLMHAAEKFDPDRGFRFSTYAIWWIRQVIDRAIMNQDRTIRTPVHIRKRADRLLAATRHLVAQIGREPTLTELAERTGIPVSQIPGLQALMYDAVVSYDEPRDDDEQPPFLDSLVDTSLPDHSDILARQEADRSLHAALSRLTPRQQLVLRLRYGMPDGDTHTLASVADIIGVTRERTRQIQNEAIRQLRDLITVEVA